ncbi:hypothetical protein PHMEG_00011899 [Phytophthora megakarya]|uniref:TRP C-terminal domain-containing protein n=1 Tax=Phytophthora megakarya TaxID=4795 RepID=A0A225WCN7_9STRA|nr:hypothetical protein PHMEG_00011899 [Phytophthora megakarya]
MGCCAKCCACILVTQLLAVVCLLAIIPAAYLSYDYYLKPWAEDHYDEAVAAAQTVRSHAASAAGDVDTSGLSCGDCLGVNSEYPMSDLNTDYSSFQVSVMNDAGNFLAAITSSGVAFGGVVAFGSTMIGALASASAMPSANGGLFELIHMIAQGQFITLLGSTNLKDLSFQYYATTPLIKWRDGFEFGWSLRIFRKDDKDLATMLDNRVVWVSIQLLLLLQYSLAMTSFFQISYALRNNRNIGGLILAVLIITMTCLGLGAFGVFILSRYKHELVDHGTEEHDKKPFNHRYGSFYQDFTKENCYFFVAKMALDIGSGAVVGAGNDPMTQLGLLVAFNAIFIIAMVVRRPYLLRVFYVIGLLTSYLRIVMLLLSLVLVSSDLVPQRIRDLIAQIIICVNALVLLCLVARVAYVAVKALTKWLLNRKAARADGSQSVDSDDLLAIENGVAAREQRRVALQHQPPKTPPVDGTPPSAQGYHQATDRFAASHWDSHWEWEGANARRSDRRLV